VTEYLVLLKLNPAKLVDTMDALRDLPEKPGPGLDLHYLMNVFGTWDVAMWFDAENPAKAVDFVHKKIAQTPGVVDVYAVPTFPNKKLQGRQEEHQKEKPAEKTKASENE
jgi:uncharacterized protein with GYD domain